MITKEGAQKEGQELISIKMLSELLGYSNDFVCNELGIDMADEQIGLEKLRSIALDYLKRSELNRFC